MQFGIQVPNAIPGEGQSQPCCNRCAARAQAEALLVKLLQTPIYNLFCFFWQKRWVMSGLIRFTRWKQPASVSAVPKVCVPAQHSALLARPSAVPEPFQVQVTPALKHSRHDGRGTARQWEGLSR